MAKRVEVDDPGGRSSAKPRPKQRKKRKRAPEAHPDLDARILAGATGRTDLDGVTPEQADAPAVGSGANGRSGGAMRAIEPPARGFRQMAAELGHQRAAFSYFWRRFLRKRYGRTFLGYLWLFLPVLLPLLVGALVFGGILGVSVPGVPYFLYFTISLGTWTAFAMTAYWATRSLEISRSEVRRVYVPRLVPLIAAMTIPLLTTVIYLVLGAGAVLFYVLTRGEFYLTLGPETALVPVALMMLIVFGLACGLWFSPLAPRARDVRRLAGYVIGFWYFLTPVMYPIEEIPSGYRFLASLNPVTAPIEMVKQGLIGVGEVTTLGIASFFGALVVIGGIGIYMFRRKERRDVGQYY